MKKKIALILVLAMVTSVFCMLGTLANTPEGYVNIALNKTYTATEGYMGDALPYQDIDHNELTDGVKGSSDFGTEWHGFYNMPTYEIIVDLEEVKTGITKLCIQFNDNYGASVVKPSSCEYYVSDDGTDYTRIGEAVRKDTYQSKYWDYYCIPAEPVSGRYFKAIITRDYGMFVFASEFEIMTGDGGEEPTDPDGNQSSEDEEEDIPEDPTIINVYKKSGCVINGDLLFGVKDNTSYEDFFDIFNGTDGITVKDKDENIKTSGLIVTGDIVEKTVEDNITDTKTVVVTGDVNSDGRVTAVDYMFIKRAFLGSLNLSGIYLKAGAVSYGDELAVQDCLKVKRHYIGSYDLNSKYGSINMTFEAVNPSLYRMRCTYEGKPLTLTFDKKSWGTWNIGTFSYNNRSIAGGGTDWEYVYRAGKSAGYTPFTGGNHDHESLIDIKFYDDVTGEELDLSVGESANVRTLKIVETTQILYEDTETPWADVVRTYYINANKIRLFVDYEILANTYFDISYTCMFPVSKKYGEYIKFNNVDGTVTNYQTAPFGTKLDVFYRADSMKAKIWGPEEPSWTFDVQVFTQNDSCDSFKNSFRTAYWDMNTSQNKLYFSKFEGGQLVEAGTTWNTESEWTFYIDPTNQG